MGLVQNVITRDQRSAMAYAGARGCMLTTCAGREVCSVPGRSSMKLQREGEVAQLTSRRKVFEVGGTTLAEAQRHEIT